MAAAAAPLLQSPSLIQLPLQFQIHHPPSSSSSLSLLSRAAKLVSHPPIFRSPRPRRPNCKRLVPCSHANASIQAQGSFDPDLRSVLELATDSELYELEQILFGPSYFSPLLKSIKTQADVDYFMIEEDLDERDAFIATLESRFFFLAADARSTIRGWRPSYRNVLLGVRAKLNILCSRKLSTEDLEAEIFLHLLQEYSSDESGTLPSSWESSKLANSHGSLEVGLSHWKVQAASALRVGAAELRAVILKGGGILTLGKLYNLGGQFAAVTLKSRVALLTAKQGVAGAAARYLGLRSMMSFLGPMLWGIFLADVVIQMLGTDYARILRAIYAFAQIRITRTYKSPSDIS
ncbi:uncharacterized protein LOC131336700 isoform X3 [Rhododendron vialii]|uniref:uncharacterized protein LOC131336700 isoform X3 n=1 Tax=Rhododendron vialii TaxID=182163 RepID=UPI00265FBD90|nr:uncharacterized protein LOC131336700 isoform X3 [Rhododendron vialii]